MNPLKLNITVQRERFRTLTAYRSGDWRNISIKENGECLVLVPEECKHPFYAIDLKLSDDQTIYLREQVLNRFLLARTFLREYGYDLIVYDGWRSVCLQTRLFWYYMKLFTVDKFSLGDAFKLCQTPSDIEKTFLMLPQSTQVALKEANRSYVSWPSVDPLCPSPHATGGAIDVWLYKNGTPVNLGIPFDWMQDEAGAFYHLKRNRKKFVPNDKQISYHRNLMIYAMIKAGFTCYGPEVWHFNFGNQMDALVKGGDACYSYIEPK